tara:strand:+ start:1897 stop:2862 length:966 start_codon:yes stop_codon:yes gene_type:complete
MINTIKIVQDLLLPVLEKDSSFNSKNISEDFWESFTKNLLDFETDKKSSNNLINLINSLKIKTIDSDNINSILENIYRDFILELAESYVLGKNLFGTEQLLTTKNSLFKEQVIFLKTLEDVIEEKRREDLKKMFQKWDNELIEEDEVPVVQLSPNKSLASKKETKIISLSWAKYAVAAVVVIAAGLFYLKSFDNNITPQLVDGFVQKNNVVVLSNQGIGFTDISKRDSITVTNYLSKSGAYKNQEITYQFSNNTVTITGDSLATKNKNFKYRIINTSKNNFYLERNNEFYSLIQTENDEVLKLETDKTIIEELEKIIFNYE